MELAPQKRFADAQAMLAAFGRVQATTAAAPRPSAPPRAPAARPTGRPSSAGSSCRSSARRCDTEHECTACHGPVSEAMQACPWCGKPRLAHEGSTDFPQRCPRCDRGMKLDWHYCPWCYGPGFEPVYTREFTDIRYTARCQNAKCTRKLLMPFMRYCPWCHRKVRRKWKIPESTKTCRHCGWGVAAGYWSHCPWCSQSDLADNERQLSAVSDQLLARRSLAATLWLTAESLTSGQLRWSPANSPPARPAPTSNADMLEPDVFELAGGTVAVFSARRPEKTTRQRGRRRGDRRGRRRRRAGGGRRLRRHGQRRAGGPHRHRVPRRAHRRRRPPPRARRCGRRFSTASRPPIAQILDLKTGAGATLAVVQLENGEARPYHVGDSQILLVGNRGKVKLLTTRHSPVGYAVEAGMLEEHEAMDHEERHLVSNYLGFDEMHVEMGSGRKVSSRDGLLVASDGVLDNLLTGRDRRPAPQRFGRRPPPRKIGGLAGERMAAAQDGKPHKPDDLTLIVFSQRGVRRPLPRASPAM